MKNLIGYYGNLSLKNKLRLSYIFLILVPVTLLCIVYYYVASENILDMAEKNILDVTAKNTQILEQELEEIQIQSIHLNVNSTVCELLNRLNELSESELLTWNKEISAMLGTNFTNEHIISAQIMTHRYVFGDNINLPISSDRFFHSTLYQNIKGKKGVPQWIPTYQAQKEFELDFMVEDDTVFSLVQELNPVFTDYKYPNAFQMTQEEAAFVVNIDEKMIENIFSNSISVQGAYYCVSNEAGKIISHSDADRNGTAEKFPWLEEAVQNRQGSVRVNYEGEKLLVCYAWLPQTEWIAASVTPIDSLLKDVSKLQLLTIVVWVLLFLMAMILAVVFSQRITRPINSLVQAMKQAGKGDFTQRLAVNGTDEMQYLTEKYNEMGERIETLIEENYKSEIRKKESEIMALNLQMNPHFLYNTLNIINMMALEDGNVEVSNMLIRVSDMMQYTFRNTQEFVIFEEEYLWLQNYLHIMKLRFEGKFTVKYQIQKEIYPYKIPKLILQPLVENSIVHGFGMMDSGGVLEISGIKTENEICLEVKDNGKGMNEEEKLRAMSGGYNRIGLSNTAERLRLIYGENGRMTVITAPGKGTLISVQLPCCK